MAPLLKQSCIRCSPPTPSPPRSASGSVRLRPRTACRSEGAMLPAARLDALINRYATLEGELARSLDRNTFVRLSREFAELKPVVESVRTLRMAEADLADVEALLSDSTTEADMARLGA